MGALDKVKWGCPQCGATRKRPPFVTDHGVFHSWRCQTPMVMVRVQVLEF